MKKAAFTYWHKFLHLNNNSKMISCLWSCTIRIGIKPKLQTILVDIATIHNLYSCICWQWSRKKFFTSPPFSDCSSTKRLVMLAIFVHLLSCNENYFAKFIYFMSWSSISLSSSWRLRSCFWTMVYFLCRRFTNYSKHTYFMQCFTNSLQLCMIFSLSIPKC